MQEASKKFDIQMETKPLPLLSICIPTYNRARCLPTLLASLLAEPEVLSGKMEIIVSNNGSKDGTVAILQEFSQTLPLRLNHFAETVPFHTHLIRIVREMARGEYCLFLGDDDAVLPGGTSRIMAALEEDSSPDFIFLNRLEIPFVELKDLVDHKLLEAIQPGKYKTSGTGIVDELVEKGEWTVAGKPYSENAGSGSIIAYVFRRKLWLEQDWRITEAKPDPDLKKPESTMPHSIIWANSLVGKKGSYLARPPIVQGTEHQEWIGIRGSQMLSEHFEIALRTWLRLGVLSPHDIEQVQRKNFQDVLSTCLWCVLQKKKPWIEFLPWAGIWIRYAKFWWEMRTLIADILKQSIPLSLRTRLSRIKRTLLFR